MLYFTGHRDVSQHSKPSTSSRDEPSFLSESMADVLDSDELSPRDSAGRWPSSNLDRAPQQVQQLFRFPYTTRFNYFNLMS